MPYQKIINWCLYLAAFLTPLFFLPWTLDPLETNKQTLLIFLMLVAGLAAAGSVLMKNELTVRKNVFNSLLIIFLATVGVSAVLSDSPLLSWVGAANQEYTSFTSFLAFVVLFWFIANQSRNAKIFSNLIISALGGALIAGLFGLCAVFGIFLPFSFAQTQTFNTVGTLNALGIFLAATTVLANSFFVVWKGKNKTIPTLIIALSAVTFVFLAIINYWIVWTILLIGLFALLLMIFFRAHELHHTKKYLIAMLMTVGAIFFLVFQNLTIISTPAEVSPNTTASFSIAQQTMTGRNFWFGSGPGTYMFDYAKFRPIDVNKTNFWSIRFDRASSDLLTALPTLGFLPSIALLLFAATLSIFIIKKYIKREEGQWQAFILIPAWFALSFSFFVYSSNFTLSFLFFVLSGLIYSLSGGKTKTIVLSKTPRGKMITTAAFVLLAIATITIVFLAGECLWADGVFARAIKTERSGGDLKEVMRLIDRAATANRFDDTYYRNLAEVLLLELKNETSTLGSSQITDEQGKYIQSLIAAGINAAKRAVALEPRGVTNWLELGSVYRSLTPAMAEAGDFAVAAYQSAINLEPNNPNNYVELGKTHLSVAATLKPLTVSTDAAVKQSAEQKLAEAFLAAETAFNKAIELKPDYAPAHYQLALAFEQQNRLDEAIGKMESVVTYNPQDVGASFELGLLYLRRLKLDDAEKAVSALARATELLPSYSNAHWYLAFAYEQQGNKTAAIAEIEKVLELNPDNETVKARLQNLRSGGTAEITTEPIE